MKIKYFAAVGMSLAVVCGPQLLTARGQNPKNSPPWVSPSPLLSVCLKEPVCYVCMGGVEAGLHTDRLSRDANGGHNKAHKKREGFTEVWAFLFLLSIITAMTK